jgi:hypothetical protein
MKTMRIILLIMGLSLIIPSLAIISTPNPVAFSAKEKKHNHQKKEKKTKKKDKAAPIGVNELLEEPVTEVTPVPEERLTKKQRRRQRQQLSSAALSDVPPAPAADALVTKYYGAADNSNDAYFPWQFTNGFNRIEDAQRPVNGKNSTWIVTDCGQVCGWDVFPFGRVGGGHTKEGGSKWAEFDVTRPVTVGYVWRDNGSPPAWLASDGWVATGTVDARNPDKGWSNDPRPVYTKAFPAGRVAIPGPSNGTTVRILPWILFAEKDGARPTMPNGYTPNQKCADAIHNAIKAPNSNWPTWHLPYDVKSHCYFGHDHGSDPRLVYGNAGHVRYGEIAAQMGMTENHHGHKNYAIDFEDEDVLFVHHFGTSGLGRVDTCKQQFHLFEMHVRNNAHTETLAVFRFMADYGRSIGAQSNDNTTGPMNPNACPNGNAATGYTGTTPSRIIAVAPFCTNGDQAYEPWVFKENAYADVLGLFGNPVLNTPDAMTCPGDVNGNTAIEMMNRSGTGRFFTPNNVRISCPAHTNNNGYFWTDAMAHEVVPQGTPGSIRQFCKPGWNGMSVGGSGTPEAAHRGGKDMARWGHWAIPVPGGEPGDFERSITDSHGPN